MISKGMDSSEFNEYLTDTSESSIIFCQKNLGYFISYDNLFSTWISADSDFTVDNLHVALSAFERYYSKKYNKIYLLTNYLYNSQLGLFFIFLFIRAIFFKKTPT